MSLPSAVRVISKTPKSAVIFFHGLGDSGNGWSWFPQVVQHSKILSNVDTINYVFPNAPEIPITANGGFVMPGWFDIYDFGNINGQKDVVGFLKSVDIVKGFVKEQMEKYNIPAERIIVGGFSQGAALTLASSQLFDIKIGGFVSLSGFLPIREEIKSGLSCANKSTPLFHGHGTADPIVPFQVGEASFGFLKELGCENLTFKAYAGVQHSASDEELKDVQLFMKNILQ